MSDLIPYPEREREDVLSDETWDGGDGTITFNYLQQREADDTETPDDPIVETGLDPWGIVE